MKKYILISLVFGLLIPSGAQAAGRYDGLGFPFTATTTSTQTTFKARVQAKRGRFVTVKSQMEEDQRTFVTENQDRLEQELAQGQGEGLQVLSALFGCSEGAQAEFAKATQRKFSTMFGEGQTNVGLILSTLRGTVTTNPRLAQSCSYTTA